MQRNKWHMLLGGGLLVAVVLACGATTANIKSFKISTDEQGNNEARSFAPGDKVYAVAQIGNNGGKVETKFRILYDDVEGKQSGTQVPGAEKTLEVEGDRPAIFWVTLPIIFPVGALTAAILIMGSMKALILLEVQI